MQSCCNAIRQDPILSACITFIRTYMHFTGFHKILPIFAGDVSLPSFINFRSCIIIIFNFIQFFCLHSSLHAFFIELELLVTSVLKFLDSQLHLSPIFWSTLFWSFSILRTPGLMYSNSSYKFEQHKWRDSHTRCQVLLQQYLEELQEPWHW